MQCAEIAYIIDKYQKVFREASPQNRIVDTPPPGGKGRNLKQCNTGLIIPVLTTEQPTSTRTESDKIERTKTFTARATFLKFLHGITSYLTLSDNEPILFFPFQQVQGNLLFNRKNGDVLLA